MSQTPLNTDWTSVRMPAGRKRKNLVVVRTGNASLHLQWPKPANGMRNWDLLLSHFADGPQDCPDAEIIVRQGAYKFSSFYRLYQDIPWLADYEAVWFCDDDIMTSWEDVDHLFNIAHQYGLLLGQATLTANSYYSHLVTLQQPDKLLRFSSFIEVMVPVFSADALRTCIETFNNSVTAWGLDVVWPHLLGASRHRVAMIDAVAVHHTRPPSSGDAYKNMPVHPQDEMNNNLQSHGLRWEALEYGEIWKHPRHFGAVADELDRKLLCDRLETTLQQMIGGAPQVFAETWHEGNAVPLAVLPLKATDAAMSFGLTLHDRQAVIGSWLEVLQIGESREKARATVYLEHVSDSLFRFVLRVLDRDGHSVVSLMSDVMTLDAVRTLSVSLLADVGWVRMIVDGVAKEVIVSPWSWADSNQVWLGSKKLCADISNIWISRDFSGEGPAEITSTHKGVMNG